MFKKLSNKKKIEILLKSNSNFISSKDYKCLIYKVCNIKINTIKQSYLNSEKHKVKKQINE